MLYHAIGHRHARHTLASQIVREEVDVAQQGFIITLTKQLDRSFGGAVLA